MTLSNRKSRKKAVLEKVSNVWGSCAGSGSDAFPIYRKQRNIELERLRKMDEDWAAKEEAEKFQASREDKARIDEERTERRSSKRRRKKEAQAKAKHIKAMNTFTSDGSFLDAMKKMDPEELAEKAKAHKPAQPKLDPGVTPMPVMSAAQMSSSENMKIREVE